MNMLRKEIEPSIDIAEKMYPKVLELILAYTEYCDENGDEHNREYKKLENQLNILTGKDTSKFNLWEWWEEEGVEVLAFRISLPEPKKVESISKEELTEIVRRIKAHDIPENDESFISLFHFYLDDYYHNFLMLHFTKYNYELFHAQYDENGNYFEYDAHEITEKIWNKQ